MLVTIQALYMLYGDLYKHGSIPPPSLETKQLCCLPPCLLGMLFLAPTAPPPPRHSVLPVRPLNPTPSSTCLRSYLLSTPTTRIFTTVYSCLPVYIPQLP